MVLGEGGNACGRGSLPGQQSLSGSQHLLVGSLCAAVQSLPCTPQCRECPPELLPSQGGGHTALLSGCVLWVLSQYLCGVTIILCVPCCFTALSVLLQTHPRLS